MPLSLLALVSCASGTFSEGRSRTLTLARGRGLVEVSSVVPGIQHDLVYRRPRNITGQRVYPEDMPCLLHHTTAAKLRVAQEILQRQGYGLKVWDAWRPPEAHTALHDHGGYTGMFTPPELMWSRHCSGTAVDVTLADAKGRELAMPTGFDEGGPDSYYTADVPAVKRERRTILQMAMTSAGFSILNTEWWHFDDATYDSGGLPVPPVVYAREIGLNLPTVKPPKVKRKYVYPTMTTGTTSATVPLPSSLDRTTYLPGADSGSGAIPPAEPAPAVITTPPPSPAPPPVMLPAVPGIAPGGGTP